ncbi:RNA-directed DNA polymerase [Thalassobacterium sedimentorum]|uniref:RNA-directed DNA polymerase n=1 Tax=Thalassobacterium sedimentorum TaxID=3041258 RepID=UPI0028123285|nr:RNA-directed DNA polymerase [Coraliomargarita sp. SDUM461004]
MKVPLRISIPKVKGGFRIASILDPTDCVYYTALCYETSEKLEELRIPKSQSVSCSYRINTTNDGDFFHGNTGYKDFQRKTREHILSGQFSRVLTLDLSDFYSQISHHRIRNNLDTIAINTELTLAIENSLNDMASNHHSQGIPVGPSASIILSEAALIDIDQHLLNCGLVFCRYVDDFRIFFKDELSALSALRGLTEILFRNHRLPINTSKTGIWSIEDFSNRAFIDEEQLEEEKNTEIVDNFVSTLDASIADDFEITSVHAKAIERNVIGELFERVKSDDPLPLGLTKFVLRRSRALKTNKIIEGLLEYSIKFLPVLRDACLYFDVIDKDNKKGFYKEFLDSLKSNDAVWNLPYFQQWWLASTLKNPNISSFAEVREHLNQADNYSVERYEPLLAARYGQWHMIRDLKDQVDNSSDWRKRSIILATSTLSPDEKGHWLSRFNQSDPLTVACAFYARNNSDINRLL